MQENFFDVNNNQNLNFQFNNNNDQTKDNIKLLIKREVKEIFHYQKLIKKNNLLEKKDFYELEIIILKDYIQTEQDISLLIIIPFNYPKYEPEIYCLTEFCHPHLCDGRNLLFDIIKDKWQRDVHNLEFIINKLPGFFVSFLEARKKKGNYIAGSFILNKYYNINRLKDLPIFFHLITHKEKKITLYKIKSHKIITISEISFCMFELDNNHTGYCKLVFFADLKDLIGIQLDTKNNEIEIKFKNLLKDKKHTKIEIISSNSENINRILLENQKKFLSYNNNYNHNHSIIDNGKKELSEEEKKIMMIEKQILYVEKSITVGDKPKKGQIKYLINLYKNAIEYYSSKNNQEKCDDYKSKINMFEPELDKYKKENNTKQNILIEDENTNIENINFNNKPPLNIDNQNLIKVVEKEEVTKINNINNIFVNNDIFNLNNISNNSSNSNTNNDIFNFIQPLSQSNNNTNNNNLLDFGFDFTNSRNNMNNNNNNLDKNKEENSQIIFDFFKNQEQNSNLKNRNENVSNSNTDLINDKKEIIVNNNFIEQQKEINKNNSSFNESFKEDKKKDKFANLLNDFELFKPNKEKNDVNNFKNSLVLSQNNIINNLNQNKIPQKEKAIKEEKEKNNINKNIDDNIKPVNNIKIENINNINNTHENKNNNNLKLEKNNNTYHQNKEGKSNKEQKIIKSCDIKNDNLMNKNIINPEINKNIEIDKIIQNNSIEIKTNIENINLNNDKIIEHEKKK